MSSECGTGKYVSGPFAGHIVFNDEYSNESSWLNLGQTDDGFEVEQNHAIQEITTDRWGDSVVNGIYRGGNVFVNVTMLEFDMAAVRRLKDAYVDVHSTVNWATEGKIGTIGCNLFPSYTFSLKLLRTVMTGATNQPMCYYFPACIVDPNFPIRYNLNSRLRVLPLRFRVLPYDMDAGEGEDWRWFGAYTTDPGNPFAGN